MLRRSAPTAKLPHNNPDSLKLWFANHHPIRLRVFQARQLSSPPRPHKQGQEQDLASTGQQWYMEFPVLTQARELHFLISHLLRALAGLNTALSMTTDSDPTAEFHHTNSTVSLFEQIWQYPGPRTCWLHFPLKSNKYC